MKQYVQTDLEADREVANTLANLIIGGLLVTEDTTIDDQGDELDGESACPALANPLARDKTEAGSLFENRPLALVAGAGFEPATSGL